jgi:flagellar motor switch protein FliN/FliY
MSANLAQILRLEVPFVVRLAERRMKLSEVLALVPGSIIELPKHADAELDLMVNNRAIGQGLAMKVGENFGVQITYIGDLKARVVALGAPDATDGSAQAAAPSGGEMSPDALADALLSGQT